MDNVFAAPAENLRLFEAAVAGLTPERVNQSARTLFAGEPILYMSAPAAVEGGEGALLAAYRDSRAVAGPGRRGPRRRRPGPIRASARPGVVAERHELAPAIGATAVRFANGVRLTVKKTDFAANQVMVQVRFGDGQLALPADRPNPNWALAAGFPAGGLGRMTFEDMQEALNDRVYSASLAADEDGFPAERRHPARRSRRRRCRCSPPR